MGSQSIPAYSPSWSLLIFDEGHNPRIRFETLGSKAISEIFSHTPLNKSTTANDP